MKNKLSLNRKVLLRLALLVALSVIVCLIGLGAYTAGRQVALAWVGKGWLSGPSIAQSTATPALNEQGTPLPGEPLIPSAAPTIAPSVNPWDGAGRVTILLLGLDYRDWAAEEGPSRSDTMILLTLDPLSKTAGVLTIPRDMWVNIPGFKHGKINTAYYLGDAYELPGGGPALAVKTVEQFLGVPINYFAQIDFGAFVRFIDEIGGVEVDVPAKITIDLLGGGFKTKKNLQPGRQVLPGEWALAYARDRHTEGGDFDRSSRQMQIIMGIYERMLTPDLLPMLISKAPTLYQELSAGIRTNLSLDEVIKLALLAKDVPKENIKQGIIGKESVLFGFSPDNLSILIPIPDKIHLLRDQIFAASGALSPGTPGTAQDKMKAEQARIAIYNGSSVSDLLDRTIGYLRDQGANITASGNADKAYTTTTIIDHTSNPFTLKYLVDLMHIHPTRIYFAYDPNSPVDVEVFLGNDWSAQNPLP